MLNNDKIKLTQQKYKNGKLCHVCGEIHDIEEFRFHSKTNYRSNCNNCNKLISVITTIHRKQKKNPKYCQSRIDSVKRSIRINELIIQFPNYTDTQIAKMINTF